MNIAEWTIKNNRVTILTCIAIIVFGIYTFFTLPRIEDPEFTIRNAVIITTLPGASPERVEELVTNPLEEVLKEIPEFDHIESQSIAGVSIITPTIKDQYINVAPIWQKMRNKVNDASSKLPAEAGKPIINDEYSDVYGILIALRADGYTYREMSDVADNLKDELLSIPLTSKVKIYGEQDERIFVEFSNARLAEYGFTPFMLANVLKNQNTIAFSGNALQEEERISLNTTGEFKTLNELKNVEIQLPGKTESIRLSDIATITRGYEDPPSGLAHFNGENSLIIAVSMDKSGKITDYGETVTEKLQNFESHLPVGYSLDYLVYQPKFVEKAIGDFMENFWEALLFVFIVMLILTGLRAGIITGLIIPFAIFLCIMTMPFFGITIQRVSIAALIIALGILVDNGVVITENLLVRFRAGQDRMAAVKGSVKELWKPLFFASFTTVCAFLPIPLAKSDVGEYTYSIFVVLTTSLFYSWIIALTIIPFICYYFLKPTPENQTFSSRTYVTYRKILLWSLQNKLIFLSIIGFLFALSVWGLKYVPQTFFPPNEREMYIVDLSFPYGTDILETSKNVKQLESYLLKQSDIESIGTFIGEGGPRFYFSLGPESTKTNYAFLIINTKNVESVHNLMDKTKEFILETYPDVDYNVKQLQMGPSIKSPIQIRITGHQIEEIYKIKKQIVDILQENSNVINIHDDWSEWNKELLIKVHQPQAKRIGITSTDIAQSLGTQITGYPATVYRDGDKLIPIIIRANEYYRGNLGNIENINVYSTTGQTHVPLLEVADTELNWEPSNIRHRNNLKTMTIMADISSGTSSEVIQKIEPQLEKLKESPDWPAEYTLGFGGEQEENESARGSIMAGVPIAIAAILIALMVQFNSISAVVSILLTVPLALIGITPGLLLTNTSIGFMAFLGFISLLGIIVSHTLMMLDRTQTELKLGHPMQEAIFISTQRRLRPVFATAVVTAIGLLPLSLQGGELWRPMANTIIFGLMVATILTLVFCPVVFALFNRVSFANYKWDPELAKEEELVE